MPAGMVTAVVEPFASTVVALVAITGKAIEAP
jgi:hypothetical protein